jgi:hypothetical protein
MDDCATLVLQAIEAVLRQLRTSPVQTAPQPNPDLNLAEAVFAANPVKASNDPPGGKR